MPAPAPATRKKSRRGRPPDDDPSDRSLDEGCGGPPEWGAGGVVESFVMIRTAVERRGKNGERMS